MWFHLRYQQSIPKRKIKLINFQVNPYIVPPKKQHLYAELMALLRAEQTCLQLIKTSEREMRDILNARNAEEKDIPLSISVYDTIRNQTVRFLVIISIIMMSV